jgi:hypothetical protein
LRSSVRASAAGRARRRRTRSGGRRWRTRSPSSSARCPSSQR